jgi:hypothetical protein
MDEVAIVESRRKPPPSRHAICVLGCALGLVITVASSGQAQQGCVISDETMVCPNGVTIGGVGRSVIIGGKSMGEGTFDRRTPDGRDVHVFGNQGVIIGGRSEAERLTPAPEPQTKP